MCLYFKNDYCLLDCRYNFDSRDELVCDIGKSVAEHYG